MLRTTTAPQLNQIRTHAEARGRTIGPQREEDQYYKHTTDISIYAAKDLFDKENRCRFSTASGETVFWCKKQSDRCFFDKKVLQDRDGNVVLTLQKKIALFGTSVICKTPTGERFKIKLAGRSSDSISFQNASSKEDVEIKISYIGLFRGHLNWKGVGSLGIHETPDRVGLLMV